jgi:hypothetical protein
MVVHQTISVEIEAEAATKDGYAVEVGLSVAVVAKDFLPLIASGNDVIDGSLELDSRSSRHSVPRGQFGSVSSRTRLSRGRAKVLQAEVQDFTVDPARPNDSSL